MQLPVSAIVVGYNEAHLLKKSLPMLAFCQEILYFDLGSKDDSREVAESMGAQVIIHEKVDSCEWIHAKFANSTKYEWLLITDPDEILSRELIDEISQLFNEPGKLEKIGEITTPWIFYFKNKKLTGTHWGGISRRTLLVHNKRFEFKALIHVGRKVLPGYSTLNIEYTGKNFIHHYWMSGYKKLFEKHLRYLRNEGEARYKTGRRSTIKGIITEPFRAFKYSYKSRQGYKDGLTGLFLSVFWAWYESTAQIKNYTYQRSVEKKLPPTS